MKTKNKMFHKLCSLAVIFTLAITIFSIYTPKSYAATNLNNSLENQNTELLYEENIVVTNTNEKQSDKESFIEDYKKQKIDEVLLRNLPKQYKNQQTFSTKSTAPSEVIIGTITIKHAIYANKQTREIIHL